MSAIQQKRFSLSTVVVLCLVPILTMRQHLFDSAIFSWCLPCYPLMLGFGNSADPMGLVAGLLISPIVGFLVYFLSGFVLRSGKHPEQDV